MKMICRKHLSLLLMMPAILLFAGCGSEATSGPDKKTKKAPLVKVAAAGKGKIARQIELTGEIAATREITIQATVEGPVGFCPWREGDRVEKGEKLIEIDRPLYSAEVREAEANLAVAESRLADLKAGARPEEIAQATQNVKYLQECAQFSRKNLERVRELAQKGGVSGEELEKAQVSYTECSSNLISAREKLAMLKAGPTKTEVAVQKAEVKKAEAALAKARAKFAETRIHAPFAGTITRVHVHPGDLAKPGAELLEMLDRNSFVVRFTVAEGVISDIKPGMTATVRLDAYSGGDFEAEIVRIFPELNRQSGTVPVEAELTDPPELMPGMFSRVLLPVQTAEDAVIIPDSALLSTSGSHEAVFVVQDGRAVRRKIRLGIEQGSRIQVVEGIKAGEQVVVAGMNSLSDGVAVRIEKAETGPKQTSGQEQ